MTPWKEHNQHALNIKELKLPEVPKIAFPQFVKPNFNQLCIVASMILQICLLQEQPSNYDAYSQQQCVLWPGHTDEQEWHWQAKQAVQVL